MPNPEIITVWSELQVKIRTTISKYPPTSYWQEQLTVIQQQITTQEAELARLKTSLQKNEDGSISVTSAANWEIWQQKGQIQKVIAQLTNQAQFLTKLVNNPAEELKYCRQQLKLLIRIKELVRNNDLVELKRLVKKGYVSDEDD